MIVYRIKLLRSKTGREIAANVPVLDIPLPLIPSLCHTA